jgi:hypothetical protein
MMNYLNTDGSMVLGAAITRFSLFHHDNPPMMMFIDNPNT